MFKFNNRSTRKRYEICWKLTIKTPKRRQWRPKTVVQISKKLVKFAGKYLQWGTIFNKVAGPETFLITGLHCRCVPENFAKFFGTSILWSTFVQLNYFYFQIENVLLKAHKILSSNLSKVFQKIDGPKISLIDYLEKH